MSSENAGCLDTGLQVIGSAPTLNSDGSVLTPGNRSVEPQPEENLNARANDTALAIQDPNTGNADPVKVEATIDTLVKDLGLNEKCTSEAKTKISNELTATDSFAVAAGLWGVAAGGVSTTSARNSIDRHMRSKGCEPVMVKVRNVMNTQKNITCNISSKTSSETVNVTSGQSIIFTINGTAKGSVKMLSDVALSRDRQLTNEANNRALLGQSRLPDNLLYKLIDASLEATRQLNTPGWGLPQIDIDGFNAKNTFTGSIVKVSEINFNTDTELKNTMIQGAQMEAETKLKESLGVDSLPQGVKSISDEKVNNYFETNSSILSQEANESKVELINDQTISVNFNGNVKLTDFNLTNTSEVDMKIETLVGMTSKVAEEITSEMINVLSSKESFDTLTQGMDYDAIMATMGDNNTKLRAENATLSGNVMGGLANLVPPFGLLMLIPLMIPLAGLFFFKSTVSKFLSPTVIKILTVVLVLFIIWVIVGKFMGGKSETRRFPSSTHEMKNYNSHLLDRHRQEHTKLRRADANRVNSGLAQSRRRRSSKNVRGGPEMRYHAPEKMSVSDVSNNLGYAVTSTKGKKRAQPYQNVTFAPQGAWTIRSN